jgi:hypothetical protein
MNEKKKERQNPGHVLALYQRETLEQCTALGIVSSAMLNTMQSTGKP